MAVITFKPLNFKSTGGTFDAKKATLIIVWGVLLPLYLKEIG